MSVLFLLRDTQQMTQDSSALGLPIIPIVTREERRRQEIKPRDEGMNAQQGKGIYEEPANITLTPALNMVIDVVVLTSALDKKLLSINLRQKD